MQNTNVALVMLCVLKEQSSNISILYYNIFNKSVKVLAIKATLNVNCKDTILIKTQTIYSN